MDVPFIHFSFELFVAISIVQLTTGSNHIK